MLKKFSIAGILAAVLVTGVAGVAAAETRWVLKTGLVDEYSCLQWIVDNGNKDAGQFECQNNGADGWTVILVAP
ncbi:MAG: hypothetical protein HOQ36_22910 [Nocardia sp.]|nr:hypothetical protein [Nocardia sp.]